MTNHRDTDVMTVAHCDRLHDALQQTLTQQFLAIHQRLDELADKVRETNGRLRTVEADVMTSAARNDERWRHHDKRETHETGERASVTRRDVTLVIMTLSAVGSVFAVLRWLWPLLHRAFIGP